MVTSQVLNGVHCERYLTNCFSFQLACGLTLGGKIAGKFTKAHPQKSRGKQTCPENSKQNAVPSRAKRRGTNPACFGYIFQRDVEWGQGFFPLKCQNLWFTEIQWKNEYIQ